MKCFLYILLFLYSHYIVSHQAHHNLNSSNAVTIEKDDNFSNHLVISLGFNCTVANMLRLYNVRQFAFPFDWLRSSLDGLCSCLKNNFEDFLNPHYLLQDKGSILNKKYTFSFFHDFPTSRNIQGEDFPVINWRDFIADASKKYLRRIERFYEALQSSHLIYLIRSASSEWPLDNTVQSKSRIKHLRDELLQLFPNANFFIIALGSDAAYKQNWKLERVRNFYFSQYMNGK